MIQAGLFNLLEGAGLPCGTRIYPVTLPEKPTLPAMTYQIVGGRSIATFDTSGPQRLRVQFDCFGCTYHDSAGLREALRVFLNRFRGALSDGTFLQYAELIQPIDHFDNEARQYRCAIEFYLHFNFTS